MKPNGTISPRAFSRLELLALLASLVSLVLFALPLLAANVPRSNRVDCLNNLRRIGQGFHMWASEHGNLFPWSVPLEDGGVSGGSLVDMYKSVSNYFQMPRVLACPSDTVRSKAPDFAIFSEHDNLSYFAGTNASLAINHSWLAGDRNLRGNLITLTPHQLLWLGPDHPQLFRQCLVQ